MVTRRGFIGSLSVLPALVGGQSAVAKSISGACEIAPHSSGFQSLAPGAVRAGGWLKLYLTKQATQLGLHLPEVSWPFTGSYWEGEETGKTWWPWEQRAYWTDGALRCALVLGDERLLKVAQAPVDYTLRNVCPNGFLGPHFLCDTTGKDHDNTRWPNNVFFRAIAAKGEATRDPAIPQAIRKHFLGDKTDYGTPSRDVTNIEGMLWAYARTGDKRLLAMAEAAWNDFLKSAPPGDRDSGDLHPERVFANAPINSHGVTYAEVSKLPAILYMHMANEEYLRFAIAAQERVFCHHMLIDGIPSTTEQYRGTTSLDAHETCDISDHMWSWSYLLMATGDGKWGDRIERACFNAGMGAIKKDWKGVQYFSGPNQFIATQNSNHAPFHSKADQGWMAYSPNPGERTACCGGNVHRFFPNYVIRMWMGAANGGLAATLYGASTVRAHVGLTKQPVEIVEETGYPFEEKIHFTIRSEHAVTFPLSLRIPSWCATPSMMVNEKPIPLPTVKNGFAVLHRRFEPGDKVSLILPMRTALSYWVDEGIGIERGPLVYALPIQEQWTPVVDENYSTKEFPGWDATPTSPWNYAIAVYESKLLSQIEFKQRPMTDDPWVDPPLALTVPVRKLPDWQLRTDPADPTHKLTPPLHDPIAHDPNKMPTETVSLVPYGATHLRLTIFPKGVWWSWTV